MTALDLARHLVAAPQWEWRPGMRTAATQTVGACRVSQVFPEGADITHVSGRHRGERQPLALLSYGRALPDLTDDATAGILLAMLAGALVGGHHGALRMVHGTMMEQGPDATLGAAVARALLDVWGGASTGAAEGVVQVELDPLGEGWETGPAAAHRWLPLPEWKP